MHYSFMQTVVKLPNHCATGLEKCLDSRLYWMPICEAWFYLTFSSVDLLRGAESKLIKFLDGRDG